MDLYILKLSESKNHILLAYLKNKLQKNFKFGILNLCDM